MTERPDDAPSPQPTPGAEPVPRRPTWQRWVAGGGLVLAGVLAGAGLAVALADDQDAVRVRGVAWHGREGWRDGRGQPGPGLGPGRQGPGGLVGGQRLMGTVSAITADSVTITVAGKDTTYALTDTSLILVDGKVATTGDVAKGDQVLVHVHPSPDGTMVVDRLLAGTLPQRT